MSPRSTVYRWGGIGLALTGLALLLGAILVVVVPFGGLANPAAGVAYYAALVLAAPSLAALFGALAGIGGQTGLVGFALAAMGSVLYGTGAFLVLPIAENIEAAHDVWVYGMARAPVIPIGGAMFLIGVLLLGVAVSRGGAFARWSGIILAVGAGLWLIAFFFSAGGAAIAALLPIGSALVAVGLGWAGWRLMVAPVPTTH